MQAEEQRLIEGLFQRLKQTEQNASQRDSEAEKQIQKFIQQQPAAPYYMAQSILIQEAALNRLNEQIKNLQDRINQLQISQQSAGKGFFGNLFRCNRNKTIQQPQSQMSPLNYNNSYTTTQQPSSFPRTSSFMSGALQTAAGVAGGVVLGNMLTNMFHHSAPEDIINSIEDDPITSLSETNDSFLNYDLDAGNLDTFNDISDSHFLDHNDIQQSNEFNSTDFNIDDDGFI
ncbi:DUF2076 domain-containing protein [Pantoea sp. Mhis]|uniref:DUF2076 domain-containing protein n=1 Tax=Pantoea sp. Mhis TaxID=2576759 RepID=UPI0013595CB5|nr:DUF2076 domain-containing protein [Pantoea sp. Mhis]MXP56648.1 DUF2076 domain-containing protein [Pantoea sp. Mhis]